MEVSLICMTADSIQHVPEDLLTGQRVRPFVQLFGY
jgi:hypothetical protein